MKITSEEEKRLKNLFELIDEDGSGAIDKAEMRAFLRTLPGFDEGKVLKVLSLADEDGSGEIEFEEFIEVLNEACRDIPTDELMQIFQEETEKRKKELQRRKSMFEAKPQDDKPLLRKKSMKVTPPPAPEPKDDAELQRLQQLLEDANKRAKEAEDKEKAERERAEKEERERRRIEEELEARRKAADASTSADDEAEKARKELEKKESELQRLREDLERAKASPPPPSPPPPPAPSGDDERALAAEQEAAQLRRQLNNAKQQIKELRDAERTVAGSRSMMRQSRETHVWSPRLDQSESDTNLSKILHSGGVNPHSSGKNQQTNLYTSQSPEKITWRPRPAQISRTLKLSYCMGCGMANRANMAPYLAPRRRTRSTNHDIMTEFYCRPCKKVVIRQVRSTPPADSEVTYGGSGDVYWVCKTCGAREMSGRPANTKINGVCNRCGNQTEFVSRGSWERLPAPQRASTDRVLFCMGCDEEEWAMAWEQDLHVVELYCYKCCGDTAWQVRRRNWLAMRPPYCETPDVGRYLTR